MTSAAIYTRISADEDGKGLGVERQREDCLKRAEREGWTVTPDLFFCDNDISASNTSRKPRPQYADMLAQVRAGRVDVILAYSNSRLTRRDRELLDLIDLNKETGVRLCTIVSGDDDLSTADGRMVANLSLQPTV